MLIVFRNAFLGLIFFSAFFYLCERLLKRCDSSPPFSFGDLRWSKIWYLIVQTVFNGPMLFSAVFYLEWYGFFQFHPAPQSFLGQALLIIAYYLLVDFLLYLNHRFLLHGPLWKFHFIHHKDEHIFWLTNVKSHPLEIVSLIFCRLLAIAITGVSISTLAILALFDVIGSVLSHSNIRINLGYLEKMFVVPQFHRTHHRRDKNLKEKNFGYAFSCWDYLFNSAIEPDQYGQFVFGFEGKEMSFLKELYFPFVRKK